MKAPAGPAVPICGTKEKHRKGQERTGQERTGQDRTGLDRTGKERKGKTTPFGVNLSRSQALYRAAQAHLRCLTKHELCNVVVQQSSVITP